MTNQKRQLYKQALQRLLESVTYQEGERLKDVYEVLIADTPYPEWVMADLAAFRQEEYKFTLPCESCKGETWLAGYEVVDGEGLCLSCRVLHSTFDLPSLEESLAMEEAHPISLPTCIQALRDRIAVLKGMDPELLAAGQALEHLNSPVLPSHSTGDNPISDS